MRNVESLIDEVCALPIGARTFVVDSLLCTLPSVDAEIETAWVAVAERRSEELRSGRVRGIPAEEVFADIDKLLAE